MHTLAKSAAALAVLAMVVPAGAATTTAASAPPAAAKAKPAGPSDKAQIEALERGFMAAFNARNADKIMSHYARDGLFVFDVVPPRQYAGWAAYKKDWQDFFAAYPGPVKASITDLAVTVVGPVAYSHSIQPSSFSGKDGKVTSMAVRVTDVYRKIGGRWLIVQEHVSVPVDLANRKPDLLSKP
jgi:uncharacterized protein (TIGR02246 family)